MKHITSLALFALLLAPMALFAQSLSVSGSSNIKTLAPDDSLATDSSSVFILYGDGYFAFTTGVPIQKRKHKYETGGGQYTATAYFAKKKKASPPAKVTTTFSPGANNPMVFPTPPVAMGGAEIKLGTSWLPVAGQQHFTILTVTNNAGSACSGNIDFYMDGNQSVVNPADDIIIRQGWANGATLSPANIPGYATMVNLPFQNLAPGEQRHFYFFTTTSLGAGPGTPVNSMAILTKDGQQGEAAFNTATFSISSNKFAHDPNSKKVFPEEICPWQQPQKLNYSICFQNDGENFINDVHVFDTFDDKLDLTSFNFVGASPQQPGIFSAGQDFTFAFNGINLPGLKQQWPEQYTYDQTIGWFDFDIATLPNLPPGVIPNRAEIDFIGVSSIWTNTAKTIILPEKMCDSHGNPVNDDGTTDDDDRKKGERSANFLPENTIAEALPNPFGDRLEIRLPAPVLTLSPTVEIFSLQGRKMAVQPVSTDGRAMFETDAWPTGVYFARYRSEKGNGAIRIVKY